MGGNHGTDTMTASEHRQYHLNWSAQLLMPSIMEVLNVLCISLSVLLYKKR